MIIGYKDSNVKVMVKFVPKFVTFKPCIFGYMADFVSMWTELLFILRIAMGNYMMFFSSCCGFAVIFMCCY